MSERETPGPDAGEGVGAVVTDPDDFNRQQRFKEIHDARQRVTNYMAKFEDRIRDSDKDLRPGQAPPVAQEQLAYRVALYVMELLPLLDAKGGDDPYMGSQFPAESSIDDLEQFALSSGMLGQQKRGKEGKPSPVAARVRESMRVFQVANRAYAELGMDLEIAEDKGDAGFDYSDILEEGPPGGDAPQIDTEEPATDGGDNE